MSACHKSQGDDISAGHAHEELCTPSLCFALRTVPPVAGAHHLPRPAGLPVGVNLKILLSVMNARRKLDLRAALAKASLAALCLAVRLGTVLGLRS
jgi:hypothetical protein